MQKEFRLGLAEREKNKEMTHISWEMWSHQKALKVFSDILSDRDILGFVFISAIHCASLWDTWGGWEEFQLCGWGFGHAEILPGADAPRWAGHPWLWDTHPEAAQEQS